MYHTKNVKNSLLKLTKFNYFRKLRDAKEFVMGIISNLKPNLDSVLI